jgi:hypothetical protein
VRVISLRTLQSADDEPNKNDAFTQAWRLRRVQEALRVDPHLAFPAIHGQSSVTPNSSTPLSHFVAMFGSSKAEERTIHNHLCATEDLLKKHGHLLDDAEYEDADFELKE